jgi:hypothetical protein
VAVVDAFDDPQAEADLASYHAQFGLPACTTPNGCFQKVNQPGAAAPLPSLTPAGNARGWDESVWSSAGSGCSAYIAKLSWQHDPNCPMRMVADAAAVADPNTGVAVYDTYVYDGWQVVGGTSVSAPLIGATCALNGRTSTYQPADLYREARPDEFWHVTSGTNVPGQTVSTCGGYYLCTRRPGYDGPTGRGTPHRAGAF